MAGGGDAKGPGGPGGAHASSPLGAPHGAAAAVAGPAGRLLAKIPKLLTASVPGLALGGGGGGSMTGAAGGPGQPPHTSSTPSFVGGSSREVQLGGGRLSGFGTGSFVGSGPSGAASGPSSSSQLGSSHPHNTSPLAPLLPGGPQSQAPQHQQHVGAGTEEAAHGHGHGPATGGASGGRAGPGALLAAVGRTLLSGSHLPGLGGHGHSRSSSPGPHGPTTAAADGAGLQGLQGAHHGTVPSLTSSPSRFPVSPWASATAAAAAAVGGGPAAGEGSGLQGLLPAPRPSDPGPGSGSGAAAGGPDGAAAHAAATAGGATAAGAPGGGPPGLGGGPGPADWQQVLAAPPHRPRPAHMRDLVSETPFELVALEVRGVAAGWLGVVWHWRWAGLEPWADGDAPVATAHPQGPAPPLPPPACLE